MTGVYCIAGHCVEIDSIYSEVQRLCAAYRFDGKPEYTLRTRPEDIDAERRHSSHYSNASLETLAVHRKLADYLLEDDMVLFHASAIAVDGEGYLFTARSGTGKSTHARLWREMLGERAVMINDDKPLLKITERGALVYGTPWAGQHRLSSNTSVPLKAICILERGAQNQIRPIAPREAWPMLLQQSNRPASVEKLARTLRLVNGLLDRARFYRLRCNMEPEAAEVAYRAMCGGENP